MTDGVGLLADVLVRRGTCPPVGQIASANTVDTQTRVVKYQPLYSRVKAADDGVTLQFASLSINAGSDHEAAMRFVSSSTGPFQVGDLPGLRPEQQTDLARTLIVSGFLVRLPELGEQIGNRTESRSARSGVDPELSLGWLLAPLTVETFINEIWGQTHYHVSRNCPEYFDSLFDGPASVDRAAGVVSAGSVVGTAGPGKRQKGPIPSTGLADGGFDVAGIGHDFADGYTIVLGSIERFVKAIASLLHAIEVELNFATQVNAYFTPPESQGFVTALRRARRADRANSGIQDLAPVRRRDVAPRRRCAKSRLPPTRSRRPLMCSWRSATCFTCRAAACTPPRRPRRYRSI